MIYTSVDDPGLCDVWARVLHRGAAHAQGLGLLEEIPAGSWHHQHHHQHHHDCYCPARKEARHAPPQLVIVARQHAVAVLFLLEETATQRLDTVARQHAVAVSLMLGEPATRQLVIVAWQHAVAVSFMLGKATASKRLKLHGSEPVRLVAAETQREIALPFGRDPVR